VSFSALIELISRPINFVSFGCTGLGIVYSKCCPFNISVSRASEFLNDHYPQEHIHILYHQFIIDYHKDWQLTWGKNSRKQSVTGRICHSQRPPTVMTIDGPVWKIFARFFPQSTREKMPAVYGYFPFRYTGSRQSVGTTRWGQLGSARAIFQLTALCWAQIKNAITINAQFLCHTLEHANKGSITVAPASVPAK
jgi:hypothetical protein